jgi:hypothetical protein
MENAPHPHLARACCLFVSLVAALGLLLGLSSGAEAASDTTQFAVTPGSLSLTAAPVTPVLPTLVLNGTAQTLNATESNWTAVDSTGTGSGWHLTVIGDSAAGKSAVFKEYCTDGTATNGCNTAVGGGAGPGYVTTTPQTLAANSLKLNSTGATFTAGGGTSGTAPTHSCASGCNMDSASAVTAASAAANAGLGTWTGGAYSGTSVALTAPTTIKAIGTGNKVYRVDLVWSLATGP